MNIKNEYKLKRYEYNKRYKESHRELCNKLQRGYYERNKEKATQATKKWYEKNKHIVKIYRKKYYIKNGHQLRDRIRFGGLRELVLQRDNYKCVVCFMTIYEHIKKWKRSLTVDHINGIGRYSDNPENSNVWKRGWTISVAGYKIIDINGKQFLEHRLVMEKKIGRKLTYDENVHHKDGNKLNNSINNLEIMSRSDHTRHHFKSHS